MDVILENFVQALVAFFKGIPMFLAQYGQVLVILVLVALVYVAWKSIPRTMSKVVTPESTSSITWDDVAGVDETKKELVEVVDFLRDPDRFASLGARVPKGVMLFGPPGTGKTLLAKAVAGESGAMFYSQSASQFVEMFAGLGAARLRKRF